MQSTVNELIYLMVGGLNYVYSIEKVFHEAFFKLMKYKPGKALAFIKSKALWCERIN